MKVEELFRRLSNSELKNVAAGVDGSGAIKKEVQNQVIQYANDALADLHKRFPLIQEETILTLTGGAQQWAFPDSDTLQLLSIVTPWGESIAFGNNSVPNTYFVLARTLYIPVGEAGSQLQLTCQKRHPVLRDNLTGAASDILQQDITLLSELNEALTAYVAWKYYRDMRTPEALAASNEFHGRYEEVIRDCQYSGVLPGDLEPGTKFEARGFV